jgi:hypothetical protein
MSLTVINPNFLMNEKKPLILQKGLGISKELEKPLFRGHLGL